MSKTHSAYIAVLYAALLSGCSASQSEPTAPEPAPEPAPPAAEPEEEVSQEERDRIAAEEELAAERMQMQGRAQVELRRWTPELREEATTLASTEYKTLEEGVKAALASPIRVPGNADRDAARKPLEVLTFFGVTPSSHVLEYGPGAGWYTEILAPVLAEQGELWVTNTDPQGPKTERATYYAERLDLFLKKSPEVYGKVKTAIFDPKAPVLDIEEKLDIALVIRGMHGMATRDQLGTWLDQIGGTLKEGGTLGVVQHRAKEGADPQVSAKQGYLPEAWVIEQVEAHGFTLDEKSEVLANPKDTKDYPNGVWTLPPSLSLGEQDRAKYVEIGESDRMTLRFKKGAATK